VLRLIDIMHQGKTHLFSGRAVTPSVCSIFFTFQAFCFLFFSKHTNVEKHACFLCEMSIALVEKFPLIQHKLIGNSDMLVFALCKELPNLRVM